MITYVLWIILFIPKAGCIPGNWEYRGILNPSDCIESASVFLGKSDWAGPDAYDNKRYDLYISSMAIPQPLKVQTKP